VRVSSLPSQITTAGPLPVLRWPALDATGVVDAVVTTRHGGVSEGAYQSLNLGLHVGDDPGSVIENRSRAAATVGLALGDLVFARQSHGRAVAHVTAADRGRGGGSDDDALADTDALVTTDPHAGLVVMVADCVPIVLVDPVARVLGCVHAGWRGTTSRVTQTAVDAMVGLGADPARVVAGIGPAIPAQRYQVGDDVADAARVAFGDRVHEVLRPDGTGRWLFDGPGANHLVLTEAGVDDANIHVAPVGSDSGDFFSDRATRPCGRFAAIARLRP
jgi:polyphenol oxidase